MATPSQREVAVAERLSHMLRPYQLPCGCFAGAQRPLSEISARRAVGIMADLSVRARRRRSRALRSSMWSVAIAAMAPAVAALLGGPGVAAAAAAAREEGAMPQPWVNTSAHEVRAGNGLVSVAFARRGNAVVLESLAQATRGVELLAEAQESDPLWELELRTAGGEPVTITSAQAPAAMSGEQAADAAEIRLRWTGVPVGASGINVEVRVRIGQGDPITHWSLAVANAGPALGLWRATFPIIPNVQALPDAKLAFPTGWGLLYSDPLHAGEIRGTYPSMTPAMQFVACWRAQGGIYFGAHDPGAAHKQLVCTPDADNGRLRLAIINYPAGMGRPAAQYDLPYEAAVGAFVGDWYEAARMYREWALANAPWMAPKPGGPGRRSHGDLAARGELRSRQSTPEWLKDIDLWCLAGGGPAEAVEPTKRFAAYFGVPTAVHWYNWHQIPFDDHYPEYFPAKEGFAQGVADLHAAGIRVMPYINGRLWDPRTDSWTAENAQAACAKDERLGRYEETYGSGVPLVVMCPYTEQWQAKVAGLVERLVNECGVDGVYVDQISAAAAVACFDPGHGHDVGGGGLWVEGYRRLLRRAREKLPPEAMLTTEESADPWIDLLDAFLLVNTPPAPAQVIPLFPAVYGGRTITFGFQYIAGDDLDRGLAFRAKMARAFAWGAQLGWVGPAILDAKYAREAEYLRELAQCRRRAHEFLVFGEMLAPPDVAGIPRVSVEGQAAFGGAYRIELPAVICSAWRAASGEVGIALTNMTDEAQVARLNLSGEGLGLSPDRRYHLTRMTAVGEQPIDTAAGSSLTHDEPLPPRSAVVLRISPAVK